MMKKIEMSKEAKELLAILIIVSTFICILIIIFSLRIDKVFVSSYEVLAINKDSLRFEIIKDLFQLLFVAVIGTSITYLFKKNEESNKRKYDIVENERRNNLELLEARRKEELEKEELEGKKEETRAEIRIDYLKRLGNIYFHIKEARRALRAGGLTSKYSPKESIIIQGTHADLYIEQINIINKYQLELENLKIQAMCLPEFIHMNKLEGYLKNMEDYLRKTITEYEKFCPLIKNKKEVVTLANLKFLDEFTGKTHGEFNFSEYQTELNSEENRNPFKKFFSESYHNTIKEISDNLYLK